MNFPLLGRASREVALAGVALALQVGHAEQAHRAPVLPCPWLCLPGMPSTVHRSPRAPGRLCAYGLDHGVAPAFAGAHARQVVAQHGAVEMTVVRPHSTDSSSKRDSIPRQHVRAGEIPAPTRGPSSRAQGEQHHLDRFGVLVHPCLMGTVLYVSVSIHSLVMPAPR